MTAPPERADSQNGSRPAFLVEVRCPGELDGKFTPQHGGRVPCRQILKEVPSWWGLAVVRVIPSRNHWNERGEVLRCRRCDSWVEVHYQPVPRC